MAHSAGESTTSSSENAAAASNTDTGAANAGLLVIISIKPSTN